MECAYEFFQNRTFYPSSNASVANFPGNSRNNLNNEPIKGTATSSSGFLTAFIEKPVLTIPPKTSINISGYLIANSRYVDCGLLKYPTKKNMKTVAFDNTSSPFSFYNIITYSVKGDTSKLENRFYVSEITNYPSSEVFMSVDTSKCGGKLDTPIEVFKNMTPDKFYIKYSK